MYLNSTEVQMRSKTKKRLIAGLTAVFALAAAVTAVAYFTSSGSGSGTAGTVTAAQAVTVNQTSVITGLAPGAAPVALSGTFNNPNSGNVKITQIAATVTGVTGCDATNFSIGGSPTTTIGGGGIIAGGNGVGSWSGLTIQMVDKPAVNQDACKNVSVTVAYTAS
jgi:hypothetical protein